MLVVDCRESAVVAALQRLLPSTRDGEELLRVSQLDVGDVEVWAHGAPRVLVERKTLADLAASICDGRRIEQCARMHAQARARACDTLYVLEGCSSFAWDGRCAARGGVSVAALQGAVLSWMWPHSARVVWCRDPQDTVAMLLRLRARLAKLPAPAPPRPAEVAGQPCNDEGYRHVAVTAVVQARKRANLDVPLCFLQQLALIPGISPRIAKQLACALLGEDRRTAWCMGALLDALRNAGCSYKQRARVLTAVPGVGPKTADHVLTYLLGVSEDEQNDATSSSSPVADASENADAATSECCSDAGGHSTSSA